MGAGLAWGAIKELIDTGLDDAQVEAIRKTLLATPGVRDLHELRTRRMAHQALVESMRLPRPWLQLELFSFLGAKFLGQ